MENKTYYTPTIEEFHEGFGYQEEIPSLHINLNTGEQAPSDLVWRDFKFSRTSHFIYNNKEDEFTCSLEQDIKDGIVRVKYLDKEDIESLGFEYGEYSKKQVKGETVELYKCGSSLEGSDQYTITIIDDYQRNLVFAGYIKNKSELKDILKKVGV